MNILNKITIKNLKLNKTRTLVAILGIILAVGLISSVVGLGSSFHKTLVNSTIKESGDYHTKYNNLDSDNLKEVINNKNNKYYYLVKELGLTPVNTTNKMKKLARVVEYDDKALQYNNIKIKEGRLPKNDSEIVVQESMYDYDFDKKIGDTITLSIDSLSNVDLNKLTMMNNISEEELKGLLKQEKVKDIDELKNKIFKNYVNKDGKKYKIVGIIYNLGYEIETFSSPSYTMITYNSSITEPTEVYVKYKNVLDTKKNTCSISTDNKEDYNNCIDDDESFVKTKNFEYNENLLNLYGIGISKKARKLLICAIVGILSVISICCIIIIKNSFNISVSERYKQYGMLSSIGSTRSQLTRNVLFEGLIEGIIAIPFGILFGMLVTYGLVSCSNKLLFDAFESSTSLIFSMPFLAVILIIFVSSMTILLSCLIPAIKISRISPIEAIRNNNEIKIKKKKLKANKLIKKIFGIGGVLADKSLKRSRKKYRTIVISVTISIILFVVMSTGTKYLKSEVSRMYKSTNYNCILYNNMEKGFKIDDLKKFKELINHNSVDKYAYSISIMETFTSIKNMSKEYREYLEYNTNKEDESLVSVKLIVLNDSEFLRISNGVKVDKGAIMYNKFYDYKDNEHVRMINKSFDIIYNGNESIRINIVGEADIDKTMLPDSIESNIIISETYANKYKDLYKNSLFRFITFYTKDSKAFDKYVNDEFIPNNSNVYYISLDQMFKAENRVILIMNIFVYTFIVIIALISITNIFNTISTNMMLRKKEFAMLRAMGMTDKEFNRMIILESVLYAVKALIYGLVISFILLYYLINVNSKATFINKLGNLFSRLPYLNIIIAILVVTLVILSTMYYSIKKINKQNIIETIRNDNI